MQARVPWQPSPADRRAQTGEDGLWPAVPSLPRGFTRAPVQGELQPAAGAEVNWPRGTCVSAPLWVPSPLREQLPAATAPITDEGQE